MADTAALRDLALAAFRRGIEAADPGRAVARSIRVSGGTIGFLTDPCSDSDSVREGDWPAVHIIAVGKAAVPMARSAISSLPPESLAGKPLVVTSYENVCEDPDLDIRGASHPIPDASGMRAAESIVERLGHAGEGELVLALISGGASALLPLPVDGVSLDDKIATTELLLASGADIHEINCVRKHLSRLKGGQLARHAQPADVQALILSDVLGDDLATIASGPTAPDETTFEDALDVFNRRKLIDRLPARVREHLHKGVEDPLLETPGSSDPLFARVANSLVGSNRISLDAVHDFLRSSGYDTRVFSDSLTGEARAVAGDYLAAARELETGKPCALIAGGETTVTLKGSGKGGRNQEMALAFAVKEEQHAIGRRWVFLSGGTDGIDGPTDAAGGLVDAGTLVRIRDCGFDPGALLDDNDAYHALQAAGDLIDTGATGTNVADLQICLSAPTDQVPG